MSPEICEVFGLGVPTEPLSYVARGELGRVSRLATTAGVWAVKEIELFVPTVDEADANVELQESMLDAGVNLPRPRRTLDGHGLFGNVRVLRMAGHDSRPRRRPRRGGAGRRGHSLACTCTRRRRIGLLIPGTARRRPGTSGMSSSRRERAPGGRPVVAGLVAELTDLRTT